MGRIWEPLREVAPGFLPRTETELEAGIPNDATRLYNRFWSPEPIVDLYTEEGPHRSIEDVLDEMMRDEDEEDGGEQAQQAIPDAQSWAQDVSSLSGRRSRRPRDTVQQHFAPVLGTREDVQRDDYESPIAGMYTRAWGRYQQAEAARASEAPQSPPAPQQAQQLPTAGPDAATPTGATLTGLSDDSSVRSRSLADAEEQDLSREEQIDEALDILQRHFVRLAAAVRTPLLPRDPPLEGTSTRALADDRISFITRAANTLRDMLETRTQTLWDANSALPRQARDPESLFLEAIPSGPEEWISFLRSVGYDATDSWRETSQGTAQNRDEIRHALMERKYFYYSQLPHYRNAIQHSRRCLQELDDTLPSPPTPPWQHEARVTFAASALAPASAPSEPEPEPESESEESDPDPNPLDSVDRPAPLEEADMTRTLTCKVCYVQMASMALLPCGHVVLCQWCAKTVVPMRHVHVPVAGTKCPLCRGVVKQVWKVHV